MTLETIASLGRGVWEALREADRQQRREAA